MPGDDGGRAARTSKLGSLALRSQREGEAHIIELIGELDLDGAPRLEEELRSVEASDVQSIVVDLSQLTFIDSTGIIVIIEANRLLEAQGRHMLVVNGSPTVRRIFDVLGLTELLHVGRGLVSN